MKICIATSGYFLAGETFVNRHIERLFDGKTCVLCNRLNGENPYQKPVETRRKIGFHPADLWTESFGAARDKLRYHTSLSPRGRTRRRVITFLTRERPDAILAQFGPEALALGPIATTLGIPLFTYFRGYDASKDLRKPAIVRAYRQLIPHLAGIFPVSQFLADNLAAHGITHPRTDILPSCVDTTKFAATDKRPKSVLFAGRLVEKKAPDLMIHAFCKAAKSDPEATLDVIGNGPFSTPARPLSRPKTWRRRSPCPALCLMMRCMSAWPAARFFCSIP